MLIDESHSLGRTEMIDSDSFSSFFLLRSVFSMYWLNIAG